MPLRTTPDKARCSIIRRDLDGYNRYQAELRYRHYRPRVILGMTNAYAVLDETHTIKDTALRQAAVHGPEFVSKMLGLNKILKDMARTVQEAHQADPSTFALAPERPPEDDPHALTPP
ncbi:hypothetical protein ACKI1J_15660 [Streptomyces scabiei]|uniref:hypothetical protein n=1 Tax=Streptomyces scabiei TaxID=1930 RepID=UPI0038FA1044